jgi:hypothetical protein
MLILEPANYGWPFRATPDKPYVDYDFTPESEQTGSSRSCWSSVAATASARWAGRRTTSTAA